MNEQELGEILKDLAIDMTNCNLLQRIEVAQAAKAKLLKWRNTGIKQKLEALKGELPVKRTIDWCPSENCHYNQALAQITELIDRSIGEDE